MNDSGSAGRPRRISGVFAFGLAALLAGASVMWTWLFGSTVPLVSVGLMIGAVILSATVGGLLPGLVCLALILSSLLWIPAAPDLLVHGSPVGGFARTVAFLVVAITSLSFSARYRRMARALSESEQARAVLVTRERQLTLAKDNLLDLVARELRQPLGVIHEAAGVLTGATDRVVKERASGVLSRQMSHMTRVIDDLVDVSRLERGKLELYFSAFDPTESVQKAVEANRPFTEAKGVGLSVDGERDTGMRIRGDPARLAQVFSHLIVNATTFTPAGGHVDVSVRRLPTTCEVVVRDTGPGLEPDLLPHLFDRLFEGNDRRGACVGLALVRGLVLLHGGSVEARNGPSGGAEFIVTLPLVPGVEPDVRLA